MISSIKSDSINESDFLFLENKLNHLDPVSAEILRVAKLVTVTKGECKFYYFAVVPGVTTENEVDKKNDLIMY